MPARKRPVKPELPERSFTTAQVFSKWLATHHASDAHFVVTGAVADTLGSRWASNVTPIVERESDDGWIIDDFTVTHTDGQGEDWNVMIPQTAWN